MAHISFPNLIQDSIHMTSFSADHSRQEQIITVCNGILSNRKPIVVIILKNPFRLFNPVSNQVNVRLAKLIHLTLRIQFAKRSHFLSGTVHPAIQFNSSRHTADVFLDNLCHQKFRHPAILIILLVLQNLNFIRKDFVWRHKAKYTIIASGMQIFRSHNIFNLINISHKIIRADLRS